MTLHRTAQSNHRVLISAVQRHLSDRYRHRPPLPFRSFDRPSDALHRVGLQPAGYTNGLFFWLVGDVNLDAIMPALPSGARGVGRKNVRFAMGWPDPEQEAMSIVVTTVVCQCQTEVSVVEARGGARSLASRSRAMAPRGRMPLGCRSRRSRRQVGDDPGGAQRSPAGVLT